MPKDRNNKEPKNPKRAHKKAKEKREAMELNLYIRYRIEELCNERGITLEKLAAQTGIAYHKIRRLVDGEYARIPIRWLQMIANVLGIRHGHDLFTIEWRGDIWQYPRAGRGKGGIRDVTIHLASAPYEVQLPAEDKGAAADYLDPERCGVYDIEALAELQNAVNRNCDLVKPKLWMHRDDPVGDPRYEKARLEWDKVKRARGMHIVVGCHRTFEAFCCFAHDVDPSAIRDEVRKKFQYLFQRVKSRGFNSPIARIVSDASLSGIVETATDEIVAHYRLVKKGYGRDYSIIVTYRIPSEDDPNVDCGIVVLILGFTGIGTLGGAKFVANPLNGLALFPPQIGKPQMKVVSVKYEGVSNDPLDTRDTRTVVDAVLLEDDDGDDEDSGDSDGPDEPDESAAGRETDRDGTGVPA
jgi:DNA-binding Xre family transcriptional regulator